jgi:hypothetical protein
MLAQTPPYGHSADTITGKFSVNISRLNLGVIVVRERAAPGRMLELRASLVRLNEEGPMPEAVRVVAEDLQVSASTVDVVTAGREGYPPTLEGSTPCFPGEVARNDIPFPTVLQGKAG